MLAVPGAVQLFAELNVFYAVIGQQRKGGVGDTGISRKWAIKAGRHLNPQDFCSASLLIQVFFAVGSWLCLLQFSTGQHRQHFTGIIPS